MYGLKAQMRTVQTLQEVKILKYTKNTSNIHTVHIEIYVYILLFFHSKLEEISFQIHHLCFYLMVVNNVPVAQW